MVNQRSTLMIMHIPKAAGTTLRWVMDRQYPQDRIFKIRGDIRGDQAKLYAMEGVKKRQLRAVFGHYCYGLHDALAPNQPYVYITMLRDPVRRVTSLYSYTRTESPAHYLAKPAREMNLHDFATSGVTRHSENGMVRQLCGYDEFTMTDGRQIPYNDGKIPFRGVTNHHLDVAKKNLSTFALVGFAERFDAFLAMMRVMFAWRIPRYENKNISRQPVKPDARDIRAITELNKLDYELYNWALKKFS